MLLGTKVPWSVSPEKRGGPWAPPPRCVLLKAVLFCVWHLVRDPASCLGNVKRFVALGLLSSFGCPLSFGPVRSVFSPLFSLSLVRLLSANVALSLSLSQVLGKCKPCSVCISPCVSSSWPRPSPSTRTSSSSPSPRLRVFGKIFGGELSVLMVCGCVVSFGVVFASILVLLERLLSRKLPDKNFLFVRSCFLGAFSSSLVSSSPLFAFVLFFSFSLNLSSLPFFSALLKRERSG